MPISLDYLDLDAREEWVAVPVDASDRAKGCVSLRIRELPYSKVKSLEAASMANSSQLQRSAKPLSKLQGGEALEDREAEALARGFCSLFEHAREIVRWGVVGHREGDFRMGGFEVAFECADLEHNGRKYQGASDRMLRLYQLAGGGMAGEEGSLFSQIVAAVNLWQKGKTRTAEEIWAEAEAK
jgi:hypothetical protein